MGKVNKGSPFEREMCKAFSMWWTKGERNDVFWRSAGSGGMAKTRSKQGGVAFGQYGDIQATDPIGQPLIDACTIELKRGYPKQYIGDMLDKSAKAAQQGYEKFIEQAIIDSKLAKSFSWLLIVRRDKRQALVTMPKRLYLALYGVGAFKPKPIPFYTMRIALRRNNKSVTKLTIYGTTLHEFMENTKPKHFKRILKG